MVDLGFSVNTNKNKHCFSFLFSTNAAYTRQSLCLKFRERRQENDMAKRRRQLETGSAFWARSRSRLGVSCWLAFTLSPPSPASPLSLLRCHISCFAGCSWSPKIPSPSAPLLLSLLDHFPLTQWRRSQDVGHCSPLKVNSTISTKMLYFNT